MVRSALRSGLTSVACASYPHCREASRTLLPFFYLLLAQCTSSPHMDTLQPRPLVVLNKKASSTSLASKEDTTDSARFTRKFGKHIQKRQLEIPEYAASFVDYKALKKVVILSNGIFVFSTIMVADRFLCSLSRNLALLQSSHHRVKGAVMSRSIRRPHYRQTRPRSSSEW